MAQDRQTTPLTGEALAQKVRELGEISREEKARACGYYTITKNGAERVNLRKFLNALLEAEGIELDAPSGKASGQGRGGRSPSYRIRVQANGNLLISSAYTGRMRLQPGDEFEISPGRKHIHLKLVARAGEQDGAVEAEEAE